MLNLGAVVHGGGPAEAAGNPLLDSCMHTPSQAQHPVKLPVPSPLCLCNTVVQGRKGISQGCPQRTPRELSIPCTKLEGSQLCPPPPSLRTYEKQPVSPTLSMEKRQEREPSGTSALGKGSNPLCPL